MKLTPIHVVVFVLIPLVFSACESADVVHDLSDASFPMVDQDSSTVYFPEDYKGSLLVVGFIYTHCPDVCPLITANMTNIYKQLEDRSDVRFIGITFDPERDTPDVLKQYAQSYRLNEQQFTMLTGRSEVVDSLLSKLEIKAEVSSTRTTNEGEKMYLMDHTNRILVMDRRGRVRMEYPGSVVPPKLIIEDINRLR